MRFLSPQTFFLLIPWALIFILGAFFEARARRALARFAAPPTLRILLRQVDPARRRRRFLLAMMAAFFAIAAIARPQAGAREEAIPSEGLDMVFLLDVSNSMLTEDVVPSRMVKARHILRNFLERLSGDRVGVVAFAGSAYPAVPLTTDYDYIRQMLDVLDQTSVSNQGTDLETAMQVGMGLLVRGGLTENADENESGAGSASRVMVILSDGESHEGSEGKLTAKLKDAGIRVFTIGIGSLKGGPIPMRDENGYLKGYKKDTSGNMILTRLESGNLEPVAQKTGGKYFAASSNEGEVEEIVSDLKSMDRAEGGMRKMTVYEEMFQYPLGLSVLLLMLMVLLRDAGRAARAETRDFAKTAMIALFLLFPFQRADATESLREYRTNRKGIEAYNDKDYSTAMRLFGDAQAESPDSSVHHLNLGDALLKSGAPEAALPEFEKVLSDKTLRGNEAARGGYNLGRTYEQQGNPEKALQSYQQALNRLAADPKPDREIESKIKRALQTTQQQKNQKKDDKQKKDEQDKKDDKEKKDQKDQKDDKKKDEKQPPQIPREKPKFKAEKLSEADAKRLLQQLQEQEKKAQQRQMRAKTGRPKNDKNGKDW